MQGRSNPPLYLDACCDAGGAAVAHLSTSLADAAKTGRAGPQGGQGELDCVLGSEDRDCVLGFKDRDCMLWSKYRDSMIGSKDKECMPGL